MLVPHRARSRLRCRRHTHNRRASGRLLGFERLEDLHHQRALCRRLCGHGGHRSRRGAAWHFRRPISEFQAIQHKLVDMATDIDATRLLIYRAASMLDKGQRVTRESAMAKLFASEAAVRIANEAVQIHGGYGFIKDYPVEKFYRDVKLCTIGEGTSEIQRLVIARQLLKD